jgi:hypothetical protein
MFGGSGIFVLDCQGNVFRGTQTAKPKDNKAWDVQFSFELLFPLWASKEEVDNDSTYASSIRWPELAPVEIFFGRTVIYVGTRWFRR